MNNDEKTSNVAAERKANLQRQFAERELYRAKKETGGVSSRFLQSRPMGQLIVLFIVSMVMLYFQDITLGHFGITPPSEER